MSKIRFAIAARGGARYAALGLSMACCVGASAQTWAASSSVDEAHVWPEAETVRMLLRADAAAALADCKMPGVCRPAASFPGFFSESSAESPAVTARQQDDIRVAAIFGSTKRLNIDVLVNGAMLRYRAGHGAPIAGALRAGEYRLLAVDGTCVQLRRGDHDHTACLDVERGQP